MIEKIYLSQLDKHYKEHLRRVISGSDFEPFILRGGKDKPETSVQLHKMIIEFQNKEKSDNKPGWEIEWENWSSKKLGKQKWPSKIVVSSEIDLLFLANKELHCGSFKGIVSKLLKWKPEIKQFIYRKPDLVSEFEKQWDGIISVVDHLLVRDVSGQYIRSLAVPVHTKFIQQHKGIILSILKQLNPERFNPEEVDFEKALKLSKKPFLFSCRFLDRSIAKKYCSGMETIGISSEELKNLKWEIKNVLLVENETNLFLLPDIENTMAICSSGKALHLLKDSSFFQMVKLFYWGDLDEEGFKMLNDIRSYYPEVESLFMDEETVLYHRCEVASQSTAYRTTKLQHLRPEEIAAFNRLAPNGRIEQEKLEQRYVFDKLVRMSDLDS